MNKNITDKSKERSDEEFRSWYDNECEQSGHWAIPQIEVAKIVWNELYKYKKRSLLAEARLEAERIRHKDTEEQLNVLKAQIEEKEDIIKSLEAKVKELIDDNNKADITIEKYFNRAKTLEAKIKDYESGHRGACFACEPVGELNKKLEALLIEACEDRCYHTYNINGYSRGAIDSETDICDECGKHRKDFFENKPFIKNLLNKKGVKSE